MGSFICRQPNGLLCRFSTVVDCVTDYNMTEEDYIEMRANRGREEAKDIIKNHLIPFEMVNKYFVPNNITTAHHKEIMAEMQKPAEKCVWTQTEEDGGKSI